jgi:hypothetical protein
MKLAQTSFTSGEISPSLAARVDLQRFISALKTCRNFFVRPQGGVSNRAGTEFIYQLSATSEARLIPFIRAEDDAYMIVLQEEIGQVFSDGAYIENVSTKTITNVAVGAFPYVRTITTSAVHGYSIGQFVTITGVVATGDYNVNGTFTVLSTPTTTTFTIKNGVGAGGSYTSGGTITSATVIVTPYQSDELAAIRYTQSADVLTLCHSGYFPSEIVRTSPTAFTFAAIADIETGPFLEINDTATTLKSSAATGSGVTLTASTSIFTANHVGALVILYIEDLSAIPPWEAGKAVLLNDQRLSNGKVYKALNAATTGSVPPSHDELSQFDGAAAVEWEYLHSLYGVARITAQAGTTATADVLSYIPVVNPDTTTKWALGAWSEDQGYPGVVTYYADRLVFARTLEEPQSRWASKVGDYHNFSISNPIVADDAITETLNSRQTNAITELIPMDQLVSLTANSTWATPKRGETWTPETIGFDPQTSVGAADLRAIQIGDRAIYAERYGTRLREFLFGFDRDKFGGNELTILARHLFEAGTIVDMDYAEYPDGILWVVRSDGALIGLTYLPEQEVIAFHRHDTDGYFERVCVIPEDGRDAVYFVVRRIVNGSTVRYLERLANRTNDSFDAFFVDCGLTYNGINTTATTVEAQGSSFNGGDTIQLHSSTPIFVIGDVGDAIQFGDVHALILSYVHSQRVDAELQSPLGAALQNTPTTEWTFARNTFSNLDHLEGKTITGLADGNTIDPDDTTTAGVVTSGQIVLAYPAGIVHIGLAYIQEIQTLTINVPGGAQIRDYSKIVPKVSMVVEDTAGLEIGPDANNLEPIAGRAFEGYTEPETLHTGIQIAYTITTLDKDSSILVRQPNPKPANILAILPTVEVGRNG